MRDHLQIPDRVGEFRIKRDERIGFHLLSAA